MTLAFGGGQLEQALVVPAVELAFLVGRSNVVFSFPQCVGD